MKVSAVTSISNRSSVNFGKKHKNSGPRLAAYTAATMLTLGVPATVVSAQQNNPQRVEQLRAAYRDLAGRDYLVSYNGSDELPKIHTKEIDGYIKGITDYQLHIVDGDGKLYSTVGLSFVNVLTDDNEISIQNLRLIKDIRNLSKTNKLLSIGNKELYMRIGENYSIELSDRNNTTSWIERVGKRRANFGAVMFFGEGAGDTGYYDFRYHSKDGDFNNFETVTLSRKDGFKGKVESIKMLRLCTSSEPYSVECLPCIVLSWPGVGSTYLIDPRLYEMLFNVSCFKEFNNAFKVDNGYEKSILKLTP